MPSKPRKLSTAIDTAPKTRPSENVLLSYSGVSANPRPAPFASATTPTTRKIASTISSATSIILLIRAVVSMPK